MNPKTEKIETFQHHLSNLQAVTDFKTDYTPLDEPVEYALRRFDAYHAADHTLYVPGRLADTPTDEVAFEPFSSSTDKKSRHGVFFGSLALGGRIAKVAVKPFEDDFNWTPAIREQLMTRAFASQGLHTLRPFGALLATDETGNERAYSLTRLEEGLTTFDGLDWRKYYPDTFKHPGMRTMWKALATETAAMHATGRLSHNDFWPRNYAHTPVEESLIIDHELSHFSPEEARDAETRYSRSMPDIISALGGICLPRQSKSSNLSGLDMFPAPPDGGHEQAFYDIFFRDYLEARNALAKKTSMQARSEIGDELGELQIVVKLHVARIENN